MLKNDRFHNLFYVHPYRCILCRFVILRDPLLDLYGEFPRIPHTIIENDTQENSVYAILRSRREA